jgi:hypothetical protein
MSTANDWIADAVNEVIEGGDARQLLREYLLSALRKHSPFKPDVVYMPVPRCDQCRHWRQAIQPTAGFGVCERIDIPENPEIAELPTPADFGCVLIEAKA